MKKNLFLILITIIFYITACSDTTNYSENTIRVTLAEIPNLGGYSWFLGRMDGYIPKQDVVRRIVETFDSNSHRFYIFCKPACSCEPAQSRFPFSMKVLKDAKIDTIYFEIYSMLKANYKHPYCSLLIVRDLPALFIIKNGVPVYSVIDSLLYYQHYVDTALFVEDFILKGLEQ